jgi:hypothetical protein
MSTVTNAPHSTAGNGGRKLIRLNSGNQYAAVNGGTAVHIYKSADGWKTEKTTFRSVLYTSIQDVALATDGVHVFAIIARNNGSINAYKWKEDGAILGNVIVDTNQTAIGNVSLAIDPSNGHLHAAWSSKNSSYPNYFVIRYSKSENGGNTWSTPENAKYYNEDTYDNIEPTLIVNNNGLPTIISITTQNSQYNERKYVSSRNKYKDGRWLGSTLHPSDAYAKSSPSAVVDKDGVIHAVWEAQESDGDTRIFYSRSTDRGTRWIDPILLSAYYGDHNLKPSITVDKNNQVFVLFYNSDSGILSYVKALNGYFSHPPINRIVDNGTSNPATLYDPYFTGRFGDISPIIYQTPSSVEYTGSYTTNQAPTLTLNTTDNFTLSESAGQNELLVDGSTIDSDPNNTVTAKLQVNDGTVRNIASGISDGFTPIEFAKQLIYSNKRIYDGGTPLTSDLAENVDHKLKVWSDDGQGGISVIAERKFRVIHNRPPEISDSDRDLGTLIEFPSVVYQVNDLEGQAVTVTEKINGQVIRTFEAVANEDNTLEIPLEMWIPLQLTQHSLTVEATDSHGLKSGRTYTFTRTEDTILLELKNPFETDIAATRILVTPEVYVPIGSTIKIEACNNAFDDAPTWEDITSMAMNKRGFSFTNTTKTAEKWGINIRFTLEKGTATQEVRLDGFGGAFD